HSVAISGLSLLTRTNQTNAGTMFVTLADFDARSQQAEQSASAITRRLLAEYRRVQEGIALVFPAPPVRGMGNAGGFKLLVEDRAGRSTPQGLQAATDRLIAEASKHPDIQGLLSTYRANVPQTFANIDRVKLKKQDVLITDV